MKLHVADTHSQRSGVTRKMRPTNSVIYGTIRYTLQAILCCASKYSSKYVRVTY